MPRAKLALIVSAVLTASCQPAPGPAPTAPQAGAPSSMPAPAASPTPAPQPPAATPAARRLLITGKVYDDRAMPLDGARVEVRSEQYPQLNQTVEVLGGAYVVRDVPERAVLTLVASKEGYTTRTRVVEALILPDGAGYDPNRIDFGGHERGMRHALSQFPEIAEITPANKSTGVKSSPLEVKIRLSHAMPADQRALFQNLLKLRFRAAGATYELYPRFEFANRVARFDWDEDGRGGTFVFDGAIVTRPNSERTVTVTLDQDVALKDWPKDAEGRMLGQGRVAETIEGTGAGARNQVAAFLRPSFDGTLPSERPEPLALWGQTHQTTSTFSLAGEQSTLHVAKVEAVKGQGGQPDRFIVTYDRPVHGFPEQALDGTVLKSSSYRFVLGNTEKRDDRESFEAADPRKGGASPDGAAPYYSTSDNRVVVLPLSAGKLSAYTHFKFFIDEAVKDASGNGLEAGGTVVEGNL